MAVMVAMAAEPLQIIVTTAMSIIILRPLINVGPAIFMEITLALEVVAVVPEEVLEAEY